MLQTKQAQEAISQVAGRILIAWKSGHCALLFHELEHARDFTSRTNQSSTFEMERIEALSGAVESLALVNGPARPARGAVRVLEHLAQPQSV
jgi:hypothetical protein